MDDIEKNGNTEQIEAPEHNSSGFNAITSQEDLDRIIKKRLDQQQRKFDRMIEEIKAAAVEDSEEVQALKARAAEQEELLQLAKEENESLRAAKAEQEIKDIKLYNAQQYGIPLDLIDNITGTTPEEIESSAQTLGQYMRKLNAEPLFNPEPAPFKVERRSVEDGYRSLLSDLEDKGLGKDFI